MRLLIYILRRKATKTTDRVSRAKLKPKSLMSTTELLNKLTAVLKESSGKPQYQFIYCVVFMLSKKMTKTLFFELVRLCQKMF